jgi:hypothetical protein
MYCDQAMLLQAAFEEISGKQHMHAGQMAVMLLVLVWLPKMQSGGNACASWKVDYSNGLQCRC